MVSKGGARRRRRVGKRREKSTGRREKEKGCWRKGFEVEGGKMAGGWREVETGARILVDL